MRARRAAGAIRSAKGRWLRAVLLSVFAAGWLVGCYAPGTKRFDPYAPGEASAPQWQAVRSGVGIPSAWLQPDASPYRLGPGDWIEIELLGESGGPVPTLVGPDGKIYFHLLPGLEVWGLTLEETRKLLEKELARYVRSPQVVVTLQTVQSRRVWVLGRVRTPGIYPLAAPMTVLEAISRAGGLSTSRFSGTTEELADLRHSFLIRGGRFVPVDFDALIRKGDMSQNVYLRPDDFIYIPSSLASEVYVLGAVYQPRTVGFKDQVTLISAIAAARGPIENAWLRQVAIVRGSMTEPRIATVNYNAIVKGQAPDIPLQPRDIVYVPFKPHRSLEAYANIVIDTFVRTVAANEGGRAASRTYRTPGVSVPISQ